MCRKPCAKHFWRCGRYELVSEASSCVVVARCCPDRYFVNLRSTELDKLHDTSVVEMRLMPDKTGSKWRVSSCAFACTNDISTFNFLIISDMCEVVFAVEMRNLSFARFVSKADSVHLPTFASFSCHCLLRKLLIDFRSWTSSEV